MTLEKNKDKFLWVMFWGAVGDALWAPVEFLWIDEFERVDNYREWNWLNPGERTDDTAMALLLADSLIRCKGFDIEDQLENYLRWHKTWYMGLRDFPEWEWVQISKMMYFYEMYKNDAFIDKPRETDLSWEHMDWNWSLMRIWPIPLYYYSDPEKALLYAWESSKATHHTDLCIGSCMYYTWLIIWAMNWASKKELLSPYYSPVKDYRKTHELADILKPIIEWSYKMKDRYQINPSGYVVDTLETALWGFWMSESFEDWLMKVVNLWGDADTTWCIYWYLAWAYYWYDAIPKEWINRLVEKEKIKDFWEKLYKEWL